MQASSEWKVRSMTVKYYTTNWLQWNWVVVRVPKTITLTWEKAGITLEICFSEMPCLFLPISWKKKILFPIISSLKLTRSIIQFWRGRCGRKQLHNSTEERQILHGFSQRKFFKLEEHRVLPTCTLSEYFQSDPGDAYLDSQFLALVTATSCWVLLKSCQVLRRHGCTSWIKECLRFYHPTHNISRVVDLF